MIHLIALLAIAMLLGLNYTHTQSHGLFTLLCTRENLNACIALAMTEHTIDSILFYSSTIVIEVNNSSLTKIIYKVAYELRVQCQAEFWHQNVVSNLKNFSAPVQVVGM